MGTTLKEILDMMLVNIPPEYKSELANDYDFAEQGIIEMGVALGDEYTFSGTDADRVVDTQLPMNKRWLAARFAYLCYLNRLWDEFNRDSVNFSTITFSIKGLEKRPESIQDQIYKMRRYIANDIMLASDYGSSVGFVSKFGG